MGLELAEQLEWSMPDVLLYPTGGGTGLVGIPKDEELRAMGDLRPAATHRERAGGRMRAHGEGVARGRGEYDGVGEPDHARGGAARALALAAARC